MSRNFELLSEAGRLHELVQSQVESSQVPPRAMEEGFPAPQGMGTEFSPAQPVDQNYPEASPLEMNDAVKQ